MKKLNITAVALLISTGIQGCGTTQWIKDHPKTATAIGVLAVGSIAASGHHGGAADPHVPTPVVNCQQVSCR